MARRPKGTLPSYRLHKQSGQALVALPIGGGQYRQVLLGAFGSPESHAEYARVIAEWQASGQHSALASATTLDLTLDELILRFWPWAELHYRHPDGTPTGELSDYRYSLRPLRELYGHTPAAAFGPLALKAVRQRMVDSGLARSTTNHRVGRIVRLFKWGVENELVPPTVLTALRAVRGLQRGRTTARETEPVRPVPDATIEATLPHLHATVRAMVLFQWYTGARPGETCRLRACDIDMTGRVWLYKPAKHKTTWRDKTRVVAIGPKAQEVIKPFLWLDTQAYLFSPARVMEDVRRQQRASRRSKVQPSQVDRRRRKPKHQPGERYTKTSYFRAIERACDRAFVPPGELARRKKDAPRGWRWETAAEWQARLGEAGWAELVTWRAKHRWHPNQLRHNYLTAVRKRYGLEGAQVIAGHAKADVTQVYAERDLTLAEKIAAEMG